MTICKTFFVTGGAGFIGSALIRRLIQDANVQVVNIDKLTYAGNPEALKAVCSSPQYHFIQEDINSGLTLRDLFKKFGPSGIFHLAAETHVDRSIEAPDQFIQTNIVGTYTLLETALQYWTGLTDKELKKSFRFLHVSTDEVFGSLTSEGVFHEDTAYEPRSPYAASKAASDHLVRAWGQTYGLPVLITNCSNNFGPYQYPEKLIPVVILNALSGLPIPIYGKGENVRDWIYVEDHADGLLRVMGEGRAGQSYLIGSRNPLTNLELVHLICDILDQLIPRPDKSYRELVQYVKDRPGHDYRYAIDPSKMETELNWKPRRPFREALRETVLWYIRNQDWCRSLGGGQFKKRIGLTR